LEIGRIRRLQVQRASLKVGAVPQRRYDPEPLQAVPRLEVGRGGVVGHDGHTTIEDVHHQEHPHSKNRGGANGISIGFATHYALMRQRFGAHMVDGVAGENILLDADARFVASDLPETLYIETAGGERIQLTGIHVADPCVEFTRFAMQRPVEAGNDRAVSEALDFLRRGMRGYYARYDGTPVQLAPGDRLCR
jgi:hypothetical protein